MKSFARYTLVGAIATAVHYALLALCVEIGHWQAHWASGFGAIVGAQVAYLGNRWYTFAHRGSLGPSWAKFQFTAALGALQGMAVVWVAVRSGWHYIAAQVLATLLSLVLTYAINRAWSFR